MSTFLLDVADNISFFLDAKMAERASQRTVKTYRQRLRKFLKWLGNSERTKLSRETIRAYSAWLVSTTSATTHSSDMNHLLAWLRWLMREERIDTFSLANLRPRIPKRIPPHYTTDQIKSLLRHAAPRERAMIAVFLDTGLRVSEFIQLCRTSFQNDDSATVIGKGNKQRTIWISPRAKNVIDIYLATRSDTNPALWVGRQGPLTASGVHRAIKRLAQRAGIRGRVSRLIHSFRVTFARTALKAGLNHETLRLLLGHETLAMTFHYAQLANDEIADEKRQVDLLADIF